MGFSKRKLARPKKLSRPTAVVYFESICRRLFSSARALSLSLSISRARSLSLHGIQLRVELFRHSSHFALRTLLYLTVGFQSPRPTNSSKDVGLYTENRGRKRRTRSAEAPARGRSRQSGHAVRARAHGFHAATPARRDPHPEQDVANEHAVRIGMGEGCAEASSRRRVRAWPSTRSCP